jgi:isoleucyl-tRNA synthetase
MPLLPRLGPKYGKQVADIRRAVGEGDVELLDGGRARVGAFTLEADEFEHRSTAASGWALAEDADWVVLVTTELDDELIAEGHAREVTRLVQQARKDAGLDITDRVSVIWSADAPIDAAVRAHAQSIAEEALATSFVEAASPIDAAEASVTGTVDSLAVAVSVTRA